MFKEKSVITNDQNSSPEIICADGFDSFTYSKISHFDFFQKNNYDLEIYGKRMEPDSCDVRVYQNLLIYSFIRNNLAKGSRILEIGNELSPALEILKKDYECWIYLKPVDIGLPLTEIEKNPDTIFLDNDNKVHNKFPKSYFDFVFSLSSLDAIRETEQYFAFVSSNIKALLKPFGYSLNCFLNVINKDNIIWTNKFLNYLFNEADPDNTYEDPSLIIKDSDLFLLSEDYFNKVWNPTPDFTYENFGKMFSYNVLWQKKTFFAPNEFNNFTYSKKSHFDLFNKLGYSDKLYGKELVFEDYESHKFQELLIYSFLIFNIKKGSKILRLGTKGENLINALKAEYEIFTLENVEELSKMIKSSDNYDYKLIKDVHGRPLEIFPIKYFDFIFTISGFDEVEDHFRVFTDIIVNIKTFKKEFALVLLSFNNIFYKGIAQWNSFLYFSFNYVENLNKFSRHKDMLVDEDLFYKPENNFYLDEENSSVLVKRICYNLLWKSTPLLSTITKTRPNDPLKKNPAYIFHHIMKCGGTSVVIKLDKWFNVMFDHTEDPNGLYKDINDYYKFKYNLENFTSDTCLVAHFQYDGFFLPQRYPEAFKRPDEFNIFTFIRDPLQLMISLYYYGRKRIHRSLENYLMGDKNFLSKRFPCHEENYKEVLDRYFFIGIVEKMQESFDKLADLTNKKRVQLAVVNKSEKDDQHSKLSDDFIKKFKENNKLDYLIYEYSLKRFNGN